MNYVRLMKSQKSEMNVVKVLYLLCALGQNYILHLRACRRYRTLLKPTPGDQSTILFNHITLLELPGHNLPRSIYGAIP